ncbi:hypothetical protein VTK26DRAFT_3214 [Humicola hyalothermophila]
MQRSSLSERSHSRHPQSGGQSRLAEFEWHASCSDRRICAAFTGWLVASRSTCRNYRSPATLSKELKEWRLSLANNTSTARSRTASRQQQ